jgi:hypothetical protein
LDGEWRRKNAGFFAGEKYATVLKYFCGNFLPPAQASRFVLRLPAWPSFFAEEVSIAAFWPVAGLGLTFVGVHAAPGQDRLIVSVLHSGQQFQRSRVYRASVRLFGTDGTSFDRERHTVSANEAIRSGAGGSGGGSFN